MKLDAPAKINLTLEVLGRRADGYHELRMVMQTVSLCDTVTVELGEPGGEIRLQVRGGDPEIPTDFRWCGVITNDYRKIFSTQQRSWNYALNGAHRLLDYIGYGGEFALANFNNMCNTWGQNVIEATKDVCYLSCMGKVFAFFANHFEPCTAAAVQSADPLVFALAVKAAGKEGPVRIFLVNHASEDKKVLLPESGTTWRLIDGLAGKGRICAETKAQDTVRKIRPEEVRPEQGQSEREAGAGEVLLPPLSICLFEN